MSVQHARILQRHVSGSLRVGSPLCQRRGLASLPRPPALRQSLPRRFQPLHKPLLRSHVLQNRQLSTEVKQALGYQFKLGMYWTVLSWIVIGSLALGGFVLRHDWLNRQYPAPHEWHWIIKYMWHDGKHEVETDGFGRGVKWAEAGERLRDVARSLEDFTFLWHRASGLKPQTRIDEPIPGVDVEEMRSAPIDNAQEQRWTSRLGCDVSTKSPEWRRGYYQALMYAAKASEMRIGHMRHKKTRRVFPPESVRSPSNPYPKLPRTIDKVSIPDISECEPVLESPEFLYKRILTTSGFTRRQRMDAGMAYASWLEYTGDTKVAAELYDWALGLALEGVPESQNILDFKTSTVKGSAPFVTPNIVSTVSALAGFKARNGDTTSALSMYTSLLRATQASSQAPEERQYPTKLPDYSLTSGQGILRWIRSLPFRAEPAPTQPSGDAPYERSKGEDCNEGALMAYIGEIVFARGGRKKEGLEWTARASEMAQERVGDSNLDVKGEKTCKQCLQTSLENWHRMTQILAQEKREMSPASTWSWLAWSDRDRDLLASKDWAAEEERVRELLREYERREFGRRMDSMINADSKLFVV